MILEVEYVSRFVSESDSNLDTFTDVWMGLKGAFYICVSHLGSRWSLLAVPE